MNAVFGCGSWADRREQVVSGILLCRPICPPRNPCQNPKCRIVIEPVTLLALPTPRIDLDEHIRLMQALHRIQYCFLMPRFSKRCARGRVSRPDARWHNICSSCWRVTRDGSGNLLEPAPRLSLKNILPGRNKERTCRAEIHYLKIAPASHVGRRSTISAQIFPLSLLSLARLMSLPYLSMRLERLTPS